MLTRLHSLGLGLIILTGACKPESNESTTDASTGSATDASTGSATDASTEPTGGDDSTSTTDAATSVDATTVEPTSTPTTVDATSDTTAGNETETGGPVEILPECQAVCDKFDECFGVRDMLCPQDCSQGIPQERPECQDAIKANLSCQSALTCEQIMEALQGGPSSCAETEEQLDTVCGFGENCSEGGGGGPGECDYSRQCRGESEFAMKCDDAMCVCTVDGMEVDSCAAEAICNDASVANLEVKFKDCCGF